MTSWRTQRGTAVASDAAAAGRSPHARSTRASLTALQNGVVDLIRPATGGLEVALGHGEHRPASGQPTTYVGSERLLLDECLCLGEDLPCRVQLTFLEVRLDELGHGQDATEEHRLGGCVGEGGELGQRPRTIAELPMRQRLGEVQLGAHDGHVGDLCGPTHAGSHAERVQRPAGQRLAQGPGSLERQASFRIATQRDLGRVAPRRRRRPIVPTAPVRVRRRWRRTGRAGPASRTSPRSAITCRFSAPLSTQRPLTTAADARSTFDTGAHGVVRARLVRPPRQLLDELHEAAPIDQEVAPRVGDHRFEIADGDGRRNRRDRSPDHGLTPAVVEVTVARRKEPQHIARSIGQQPLIERQDHFVGTLEPARGTSVQLGQPTG